MEMERKVTFLGKMPDPFLRPDGTRVSPEEWPEYKKQLRDFVVDFEYGGMPPRPEVVKLERLNDGKGRGDVGLWYRITAGSQQRQLSFLLELLLPAPGSEGAPLREDEKYPVLLTGDGCYRNMELDVVNAARSRGYVTARFNRLELANDVKGSREGGLYDVYPGMTFSDISAWAWGYLVCMDVLERIPFADETEVGITGHSRGGKTVLLAGAVDERIKYVCPNNSGCHGAVSHRCVVTGQGDSEKQWGSKNERIRSMFDMFPTWMGPKLEPYIDREQDLPYDMHYFGALIAPRYYLQHEGMQDYWSNPIGAWQNFAAVKACYRYLGCEDHAGAWFRPGGHRHKLPDFESFLDFMDRARAGLALAEHLQINPYPDIEKNFDW